MKSIIQKGIIPGRTQSQDQEISNQSTMWVTTFIVCAVLSLSFQAVVLLTKTATNHRFFQSSLR